MGYSDELSKAKAQKRLTDVSDKANNTERKTLNIGKGNVSQYTKNITGRPVNEDTDFQRTNIGTNNDN